MVASEPKQTFLSASSSSKRLLEILVIGAKLVTLGSTLYECSQHSTITLLRQGQ